MNINNFSHDIWHEITRRLDLRDTGNLRLTSKLNKAIIERFFKPYTEVANKIKNIDHQLQVLEQLNNIQLKDISLSKIPLLFKKALYSPAKNIPLLETQKIETTNDFFKQKTWKIVYDLFSGEENFAKIPILDLGPIEHKMKGDYIDYIEPQDMPYPIMRGIDKDKRAFFAIRNNEDVQVFFQRESFETAQKTRHPFDSSLPKWNCRWAVSGSGVINFRGSTWIDEEGEQNKEVTQQLKNFIRSTPRN